MSEIPFPFFFQILFDVIDTNKDGYIQLEEFQYAVLYFMFSSGPDSPLSIMFGPVPDEENWSWTFKVNISVHSSHLIYILYSPFLV